METIFALSTGVGKAGVAVIRLSGSETKNTLANLTGKEDFIPRKAILANLYDSKNHSPPLFLDQALILFFPAPNSYTGEDMAELHIHGGLATREAVLATLDSFPKLRMAEPGEFTKRAFYNDKINLLETEGLSALIDAETELQRKQALRQLDGALTQLCTNWRQDLMRGLALLEVEIDFSEEDLPQNLEQTIYGLLSPIDDQMRVHLDRSQRAKRIQAGLQIVIAGPPNVGKSTLMNWLSGQSTAIVSEQAGTTRDLLKAPLVISGVPITLIDSAGLRETKDPIEQEGVKRAYKSLEEADLIIIMTDIHYSVDKNLAIKTDHLSKQNYIRIINKVDLNPYIDKDNTIDNYISFLEPKNLDIFYDTLVHKITELANFEEAPAFARERHQAALKEALGAIEEFLTCPPSDLALKAELIRTAITALDRLLGRVDIEQILDILFKEFCIGK